MIDELQGDAILSGPGRDAGDAVIDPVFAVDFPIALADHCVEAGIADNSTSLEAWAGHAWSHAERLWSMPDFDTCIIPGSSGGVMALRRDGSEGASIRGVFTGSTLCVDSRSRGLGIGRDLVVARLIQDEALPTWSHDKPGYSPAGAGAVFSARSWLMAELRQEPGL